MGPLVDTSVLIDYFRGARTREADVLERCFDEGRPMLRGAAGLPAREL